MNSKKNVLITGANKGIGFETAKRMAGMGYQVYLGCRDPEKGKKALENLQETETNTVSLIELNVTDIQSIQAAFTLINEVDGKLDVLINNAATGGVQPQTAAGVPLENLYEIFDTNYFGVIRVTQVFLPLLMRSDAPRIVNVSSELASLTFHSSESSGYFGRNLMGYSSSKTALNAYTIMLNNEIKNPNFKINSVSPGLTSTDLTGNTGGRSAEQASEIITEFATLDNDGPSGGFFGIGGRLSW
jgi:NAD(P)-dependent dehydrogenase (short-subunit alcohol dehydrogenase family)